MCAMKGCDRLIDRDVAGASPRGPWRGVPDAQWNDWRWQQQNRVRDLAGLERLIRLSAEERAAFEADPGFFDALAVRDCDDTGKSQDLTAREAAAAFGSFEETIVAEVERACTRRPPG